MIAWSDVMTALPEVFLAAAAMVLLLIGVMRGRDEGGRFVSWLAVLTLVVTGILVVGVPGARSVAFNGLFVTEAFARFSKILILAGGAAAVMMGIPYNEREQCDRFEFPILVAFATTGMMIMVSANDLLSLYLGLELQSLSLYVLAAFKRDRVRSTEAGLKYFVLGALSSGMLLFGASLIYGFAGTTSFDGIARVAADPAAAGQIGIIVGIVFLSVGLAFKSSAVPFHMWTPDVYEGAPTPVTAFFAVAPKVAALSLFMRVMIEPLGGLAQDWRQIIWFISAASMIVGAYAAISQTNIKRLMAYSSIGHVGYALMGLAAGTPDGIRGVLIYLAIYLFMNAGTFGVILCMGRDGRMVERIADLAGLSRTQPGIAAALAIFMFSMAGIPPLAGIFAKVFVFLPAIQAGLYVLAVVGVLTSVVGAFYYLRIVKIMYFDEPAPEFERATGGVEARLVIAVSGVVILLFWLIPAPLMSMAETAAAALFVR